MSRFVCLHGHFYQPPRENAWLEQIEVQDSAAPYHDWNARVSAECYAPNTAARILGARGLIVDIVNNYASISFDAGPTLLSWLERAQPGVYRAILEADRAARARFHGHGGAMAQAYSHLIMPLATRRDKRTQVLWGLKDFEARFGRRPEGMWLPETAVDLESLDIMAEQGILFTVLAPHQAAAVREPGGAWRDVGGARVDPRRPYLCRLPSGRTIALFFYDGPIAHDIAFGALLRNGGEFADRLAGAFSAGPAGEGRPEIVHVATDGETYGHHHRFGEMALAYALRDIEERGLAEVTVYGDYLERFPPVDEVRINESTSWSCAHGVERWRSDCGCNSGAHPGWNQKWRAPLREAMTWLGGRAGEIFEGGLKADVADPWAARDDYIRVVLDRSPESVESFLADHVKGPLGPAEKVRVLKLLELGRHAMLIFTSDGWFFDDISNVETVQIVQYAARAIQLARDPGGLDLEAEFVGRLEGARSNIARLKNGAVVYDKLVRTAVVDFLRLGANFAVSSLFEDYSREPRIAHYAFDVEAGETKDNGRRKLAVGRVRMRSNVTWEERTVEYAVLHLGDQNITAGVREPADPAAFERMREAVVEAFGRSDMAATVRLIDREFRPNTYTLWHLFRDERRKILFAILEGNMRALEADFRKIFDSNYAIMQAVRQMDIPLPEALSTPAQHVLNAGLRRLLEAPDVDVEALRKLAEEYETWSFKPDGEELGLIGSRAVGALVAAWTAGPEDVAALTKIEAALSILKSLKIDLDLWPSQNAYFSTAKALFGPRAAGEAGKPRRGADWVRAFKAVGALLGVDTSVFLPQ